MIQVRRGQMMAILSLLAIAITASCHRASDRSPVIVTLNTHDVHRDEFERFLELKMGEFGSPDVSDSIRSQMLDEFLRRRLVLDEAARLGLTVANAEMEQTAQDNPQMKSTVASAATREELVRDLLVD